MSSPRNGSPKRGKVHKIQEYANRAKTLKQNEGVGLLSNMRQPLSPDSARSRTLAVETHLANEIAARRPAEEPVNYSFDVHGSSAVFAPQRGIDIGLWAAGSGFKITAQNRWYNSEGVISLRKFFQTNMSWQIVTAVCVLLALFLSDLFVLLQVQGNMAQDLILSAVLVIFSTEFVGLCSTDLTYPFSFYFWMDMVGTLSMISDISFMLGPDAMEPYRVSERRSGAGNAAVIRTARICRLGARAGRLSRVLKIMKYLTAVQRDDVTKEDEAKMAKVISNQLNEVLATRVAFLTIFIAVCLPMFVLLNYPETDDSLGAWAKSLSTDASAYFDALDHKDKDLLSSAKETILAELHRFTQFYKEENYGPYRVCIGEKINGVFHCQHDQDLDLSLDTHFKEPVRKQSIWVAAEGAAQCFFNVEIPNRLESAADIGRIWFIIFTMVSFGWIMNQSVSIIALQPLEHMLSAIRNHCALIFKFTNHLQDDGKGKTAEGEESNAEDMIHNEFVLLEKAVSKLAAIADLSSGRDELVQVTDRLESMEDEDMLVLNLQGVQVPTIEESRCLRNLRSTSHSALEEALGRQQHDEENEDGTGIGALIDFLADMIPSQTMDSMDTEEFDATDLSMYIPEDEDKMKNMPSWIAMQIVCAAPGCSNWVQHTILPDVLRNFTNVIESKYFQNPFHNFAHALDVSWAIGRKLVLVEANTFISDVTQFWLLIAALGHDLGHEGVNNGYLIETSHQLARTYNDRSPLENMHCATLFQILGDAETNLFNQVEKLVYKEIRKGMVTTILHTDIVMHSDLVKSLALLYQMNSDVVDEQGEEFYELIQSSANYQNVLNMFLHCADVGNPMKPWPICQMLSQKVMAEFFAQGDLEKLHGIPVQMLNDRTRVNIPNSQIGFIEFLIAPMVESVVRLFPPLHPLAEHLASNMESWLAVWSEKSTPPQDQYDKVLTRVEKVSSKLLDVVNEVHEEGNDDWDR